MPGLDGLDLAKVLNRFKRRRAIVFVTAYDDYAVDAFELQAVDYVLKPVRAERLGEAVRRVSTPWPHTGARRSPTAAAHRGRDDPRRARRRDPLRQPLRGALRRGAGRLRAPAHGTGSHLGAFRSRRWRSVGPQPGSCGSTGATWSRLHHIDEVRIDSGRCTVRLGEELLQVSRRHTRELRDPARPRARLDAADSHLRCRARSPTDLPHPAVSW
jgi:DNA-binding response OmpR family regulator